MRSMFWPNLCLSLVMDIGMPIFELSNILRAILVKGSCCDLILLFSLLHIVIQTGLVALSPVALLPVILFLWEVPLFLRGQSDNTLFIIPLLTGISIYGYDLV